MTDIIKVFGGIGIAIGAVLILLSFSVFLAPLLLPIGLNSLLGGAVLIAFARAVELLESIDNKLGPAQPKTVFQSTGASATHRARFNEHRWNTLVESDPEIAAAVERLRPLGKKYVDELAEKFLALNDKKQLDAIVREIIERCLGQGE